MRAKLTAKRQAASRTEPLLDFISRVSHQLEPPRHLKRFTDAIERSFTEPLRLVVSTPPQHGKTISTIHGLVWAMLKDSSRRNAYVTYEAGRAEEISLQTQWIADSAGLKWTGNRTLWRTDGGGGLIATGIGGPLTGYGIDGLMVVDDPVKNRAEAESSTIRDRTIQWFRDVALTRVHPGASVIIIQTRWHGDDLAGQMVKEGWRFINLPAINDGSDPDREMGEALWESKRPKQWLEETVRPAVGEYTWASLYQGRPRPRGGTVFKDPTLFTTRPGGLRIAVGVDFAYSKKTYADYSVAVVLGMNRAGECFVLDVQRHQVEAPEFCSKTLRPILKRYGCAANAYIGGTEKGIVDFMLSQGVRVNPWPAQSDKFTRAQGAAAAWNDGKIHVLEGAPWLEQFLSEVCSFTGVADSHDDQVDALVAAFDALHTRPVYRNIQALPPC